MLSVYCSTDNLFDHYFDLNETRAINVNYGAAQPEHISQPLSVQKNTNLPAKGLSGSRSLELLYELSQPAHVK